MVAPPTATMNTDPFVGGRAAKAVSKHAKRLSAAASCRPQATARKRAIKADGTMTANQHQKIKKVNR